MTSTNQSTGIKFLYLSDPKNKERIITIARSVNIHTKEVSYAFAVCQPSTDVTGFPIRDGDQFRKKIGRDIAVGRLACLSLGNAQEGKFSGTVSLDDDRPIQAILNVLARDSRVTIARCAQEALRLREPAILESAAV